MIVTNIVKEGTKDLIYTYSNANRYIVREDGAVYEEAYDVPETNHTYTEGDPLPPESVEWRANEALKILLGKK